MHADAQTIPSASERGGVRRLRILQVVPTYYPAVRYGGPIRSVHGLATALVRRGHEVHVYTTSMDGPGDLDVPLDRPVDLDGVAVHYFRVPVLRRFSWSPSLGRYLRDTISQFDIAHLHSVFTWPISAAARIARQGGVPYVIAPRGMLVREIIDQKNRLIKELWIRLSGRTALANAAGVHVTADLEGQELRSLGLPSPQLSCIPNGVEWPTEPLPLAAGPFAHLPDRYVLFLSRICWKKGLDRLVRAWASIADVPLVIAGHDDEGYRAKLETLARSLGILDRLIFIGPASDAHKWALYKHAQLFVLPSYSENFGNVVAEAMAMSCPVVLSPEVGIAPLVSNAAAGVVTDCAPAELASVIKRMLADESGRREMGRRGAEAVRAQLSWDAVAAQTEALYLRVNGDHAVHAVQVPA